MIAGGAATESGCAEPSRRQAERYVCPTADGLDFTSGLQGATTASVSARRAYSPFALHTALACCVPERRAGEARRYWLAWPQRADTYLVSARRAYSLSPDTDETAVNPRPLCSFRPRPARPGLALDSRGPVPRITACRTPTVPATRSRSSSVAASNFAARQWRQERAAGQDALRTTTVRMDASTLLVSFGVPASCGARGFQSATGGSRGVARSASNGCRVAAAGDRSFGFVAAGKRDRVQKSRLKLNRNEGCNRGLSAMRHYGNISGDSAAGTVLARRGRT